MAEAEILLAVRDGVAHIQLNRPGKRNALSAAMRSALWQAIDQVAADDQAKVLLLSGSGEHFCSGGDIAEMRPGELDAEAGKARITPVARGAERLLELPKPVVVAIDGCAYGAGCSLALTGDYVIATERVRFCMSFLRLGLVPDAAGLYTLARCVGWVRAKDLFYTTREVGGAQALGYGMVSELAAPESLHARARQVALALAQLPPVAFSLVKSALLRTSSAELGSMREAEIQGQAIAYTTDYHAEAVRKMRAGSGLDFQWPPP